MKPFLKWAGNKYAILDVIRPILASLGPASRLIEPFAGSGAVFLNTAYPNALLCDSNADLITLYQVLQGHGAEFIPYARSFFTPLNNEAEAYYHLREAFNTSSDPTVRAALFLYLNRHGFNGLCRYNRQGRFNVPFGRYRKPYFPEAELFAFLTKAPHAVFCQQDFLATMAAAQSGDVVYCDPPYVPLSKTANFTDYGPQGFGPKAQEALAKAAQALSARGVAVLLSNHDTPYTRQAYQSARITTLSVQRYISCQGNKREKVPELLALFHPADAHWGAQQQRMGTS